MADRMQSKPRTAPSGATGRHFTATLQGGQKSRSRKFVAAWHSLRLIASDAVSVADPTSDIEVACRKVVSV